MTDLAERPATLDSDPAPGAIPAADPVPGPTGRSRAARTVRRGHSLQRIAFVAFVAFIVVVLAAVAFVTLGLVQLSSAVTTQTQVYGPAVIRSNNAFAGLLNQETGVRGYAISGNATYLEPYTEGLAAESANVAQLRGLLPATDTRTVAAVDAVAAAAATWRREFAVPLIAAQRAADTARVTQLLGGDRGRDLFDAIRSAYADLNGDVTAQRTAAVAKVQSAVRLLTTTAATAAGIVLITAVTAWVGLRRRVIVPVARLAAESREVADGHYEHEVSGGGPAEIDDLAQDVEAMRRRIVGELAEVEAARAQIERTAASLARSNADLEQFAYVASHDLQEPLRKVSNFCQLLERQYGDRLDDRAGQYIHFAVDGAKRMQVLINDLLSFSRVGRNTDTFVDVALADVVREALDNLAEPLQETGGLVHVADDLPVVPGDRTLLVTLLQNLVGNALKYHGEQVPRVEITAARREMTFAAGVDAGAPRFEWVVTVADNGIGIEPQYAHRIFVIFQRLHLRDSYGGTGIGLAMCKKIVEFHGGTIWLDPSSEPQQSGARFCFTLPEGTPS